MKVRDEKAFCENCSWSLCSADKMDNNDYRFLTILYSDTLFSILIGGRSATNNYYKLTKRNVSIMQGLDCIVLSSVQICPVGQVRSLAEGEMSGS